VLLRLEATVSGKSGGHIGFVFYVTRKVEGLGLIRRKDVVVPTLPPTLHCPHLAPPGAPLMCKQDHHLPNIYGRMWLTKSELLHMLQGGQRTQLS
jgi:hypothetical protein